MALGTEEADYNTAVDAYVTALKALFDAADAGERFYFALPRLRQSGTTTGDQPLKENHVITPLWDVERRDTAVNLPDVNTVIPTTLEAGTVLIPPKVTNIAGDLT